jgi:hypothetical protein
LASARWRPATPHHGGGLLTLFGWRRARRRYDIADKPFIAGAFRAQALQAQADRFRLLLREVVLLCSACGSSLTSRSAMPRLLFVLLVFSVNGNSQWLSLGVTGGVPVSPQSAAYGPATIRFNPSSSGQGTSDVTFQAPNDFYQKPYAVGPTVEISLPWHLSLEAGMLYERFHQDVSEGITPSTGGGVNFGFIASVAATHSRCSPSTILPAAA